MNKPSIKNFGRFFVIGCPQFGDPKQMCPGLAWNRLKEMKEDYPIPSDYDFEIGLRVYPRNHPDRGDDLYTMAGIPQDVIPSPLPVGYFAVEIPENLYAVFEVPELDQLAQTFAYIDQEWLPHSEFLACHGYAFETITHLPECRAHIWVPISEKSQ